MPFWLPVVYRRKARDRSCGVMPGPSSATVSVVPAADLRDRDPDAAAVGRRCASIALSIRLSRICSRCPAPRATAPGRGRAGASATSLTPLPSATGCQAATRSRHRP